MGLSSSGNRDHGAQRGKSLGYKTGHKYSRSHWNIEYRRQGGMVG